MEPKTCACLKPERRAYVDAAMDHASSFPNGAFMAYMDEKGIDVSELEVYSEEHLKKCPTVK